MSNFVTDNTTLPFPKTDVAPLPPGVDTTKNVVAADWNAVCQALIDLRGAVITAGGQVFRYTVLGGDTASITIGATQGFLARANNSYNVQVTQGEFTNLLVAAAPPSLYTTTQFVLKLSGAPTPGDTFLFTVQTRS